MTISIFFDQYIQTYKCSRLIVNLAVIICISIFHIVLLLRERFTIIFTSIRYQWLRVKARLMEARAIRNINSREANMNSKSCVNCRLNKRLHTARKESSKI